MYFYYSFPYDKMSIIEIEKGVRKEISVWE